MNIISFIIILFFIEYFPINCSNNQSLPSSTDRIQTFDISYSYNTIKDVSSKSKFYFYSFFFEILFFSFNKNTN
jgi:hypothetical protein